MTFETGSRKRERTSTRSRSTSRTFTVRGVGDTSTSSVSRTGFVGGAIVGTTHAWRWLKRTVRASLTWLATTVTPVGWLVSGAGVVALPTGFILHWPELVVIGAMGLMLALISGLFLLGGRSYEVAVRLESNRVVVGTPTAGAISVTNTGSRLVLPGSVEIPVGEALAQVNVPTLRRGAEFAARVVIPSEQRGVLDIGPARSVRGDPIGILRRVYSYTAVQKMWVHPKTVLLPSTTVGVIRDLEGIPSDTVVSSDIAFHAIREYAPGDEQRHVHWKSTAKTGQLMVRQYEETRRSTLAIVLSRAQREYAGDDEFELAVSAAATLAERGLRDGRDTVLSVSETVPEFTQQLRYELTTIPTLNRAAMLDGMSGVRIDERATSLSDTAQLTGLLVEGLSVVFLVVGSVLSLRDLQAAALRLPQGVAPIVVRCDLMAQPGLLTIGGLTLITIALIEDLPSVLKRWDR